MLREYRVKKSSRTGEPDVVYVFKKLDFRNAWYMSLSDNWEIAGNLPEQVCLISLQGIVSENKPNLYFTFGIEYPFNWLKNMA